MFILICLTFIHIDCRIYNFIRKKKCQGIFQVATLIIYSFDRGPFFLHVRIVDITIDFRVFKRKKCTCLANEDIFRIPFGPLAKTASAVSANPSDGFFTSLQISWEVFTCQNFNYFVIKIWFLFNSFKII